MKNLLDLSKKSEHNTKALKAYYPNLSQEIQEDIFLLAKDSLQNISCFTQHYQENKQKGYIPYPDWVLENMIDGNFNIGEVEIIRGMNANEYKDVRVVVNSNDTYRILVDRKRKHGGSYLEEGIVNLSLVISLKTNTVITGYTDETFAKDYSMRKDIFVNV